VVLGARFVWKTDEYRAAFSTRFESCRGHKAKAPHDVRIVTESVWCVPTAP
jgi:hypothetical protein